MATPPPTAWPSATSSTADAGCGCGSCWNVLTGGCRFVVNTAAFGVLVLAGLVAFQWATQTIGAGGTGVF